MKVYVIINFNFLNIVYFELIVQFVRFFWLNFNYSKYINFSIVDKIKVGVVITILEAINLSHYYFERHFPNIVILIYDIIFDFSHFANYYLLIITNFY
jgi:hypothetical protein